MKPDKARLTAFNILKRVLLSGGYSTIVLDEEIRKNNLLPDERKFAARISYGVLERKITLEIILNRFVLKKAKPDVEIILLMGIYQLLYLDSVPNHAAVDSSVELTKMVAKNKAAAGFVNAVLHKVLRENKLDLLEDAYSTDIGKYSVSPKMLSIIKDSLKIRANAFLLDSFDRAPVYIRVNTLKTTTDELISLLEAENIAVAKTEGFNDALRIEGNTDIANTESFKNGFFFVQDLSSQMAVKALEIESGNTVFDLCAAPGGKSFTAAMYLKDGNVTSFDIHDHKIKLIKKSANRLGIENLTAEKKSALDFSDRKDMADRIICDVPCSGSGVIRRKPEIRYKNEDLTVLYDLQRKILDSASKMLKAGGKLLYSTCSVNKKENEDIIKSFLDIHPDFKVLNRDEICGKIKGSNEFGTTVLPEDFGGDGFFFSVLERYLQ